MALTLDELEGIILNVLSSQDDPVDLDRGDVIDALFAHGLITRVRRGGADLIRSRMAETIRLLARLRQIMPQEDWRAGRPLVADYRIAVQAKLRPRRR